MAPPTSKILNGKPVALVYETELKRKLEQLQGAKPSGAPLALLTVQAGMSPDMQLYTKSLGKVLARFGIRHVEKICRSNEEIQRDLIPLFKDPSITGIMVFSPLPDSIDANLIFLNLPRKKDVEGRTFIKGNPFGVLSPTSKAVMALLNALQKENASHFRIKGKHAVMVGHSDLVGKPTAVLLLDEGATVTVCHKDTLNLQKHVSEADILIVAIGKPGVIRPQWVKKGAVVLDVGENVVNGKIVGDVDLEAVLDKVSYISPVPGGVGPLTNLMVIENLITLNEYNEYKDQSNGNY